MNSVNEFAATTEMPPSTSFMIRLGVAALIGLATGLEREWSGHATGPNARFAGLRTFLLLGLLGGSAGLLLSQDQIAAATSVLAGGSLIAVAAYVMAVRQESQHLDGTTEVAALLVVALGALAGLGWLEIAAAAGSVAVLALSEKTHMQWFVKRVGGMELRAALQFAVLALVLLPLLPEGPIWGSAAVRPRLLWVLVLLLSGVNYAGYLARRLLGADHGLRVGGALGGLVSSTAVTLTYSRRSRNERALGASLAQGVVGACLALIPRVLIVSALLNRGVAQALILMLLPSAVIGGGILAFMWRRNPVERGATQDTTPDDARSPLELWTAIRMAVLFQLAIMLLGFVRTRSGTGGVYGAATLLGLADVDALTVSMSRSSSQLAADVAARAIAIGVVANTVLKLGVASYMGAGTYRRMAMLGLLGILLGSIVGIVIT